MKLRPHHLLCTQTFTGKGYSADFVENMQAITAFLRRGPDAAIELTFGADCLCAKCPKMSAAGRWQKSC